MYGEHCDGSRASACIGRVHVGTHFGHSFAMQLGRIRQTDDCCQRGSELDGTDLSGRAERAAESLDSEGDGLVGHVADVDQREMQRWQPCADLG